MQCPRCEAENPAAMKFCGQCAAPLASSCPACKAANPPENKFCGQCATPLGAFGRSRFSTPDSYTPKHLAEKILSSKAALEGERKQVTVLFADLKGSMELLADRDPEEARQLLDPVLELMMEAVHRYDGTVNQVTGDGIMALFGAPVALEDHAVRACYAALRMQEAVRRYAKDVPRTEAIPVRIRVGINSGEVVVRSIGGDLHTDYTAIGQTTHLAARMEQMAMPGSILITERTLALAEGYVRVKPLGPLAVKGLGTPIEAYEIVSAGTVRSRLHAAALRGLTRFVGRDSELDQLRQALEQTGAGHGQVVTVVGEPGVGKSRLCWEFCHSHRTQGWLLVEGRSVSYGRATAYLPIVDLLKAYFQVDPLDDAARIREKVTGKLLALDRALESSQPALLGLLDVPVEDPQWEQLDPPHRRQRTLDGVKRLLLRESQAQPLLVLVEDLHQIDAETQALLDGLVESLRTARLLLLVSYRPEYHNRWSGKSYYRQLRVDPLRPECVEELLEALLGSDPGLEPLKRLLIERTEGNPFFIEESVRTLDEAKVLAGERGEYHLATTLPDLQIPATAQAMVAARIDRLTPADKRLLQAAAVIGRDVPSALLQAIADLSGEQLRHGLARLQAAEFLSEARLFPDLEYTFKNPLTHDVAYGSLLHDRRCALHAQIVHAIEALYPNRLPADVDQLARHASRGELWAKAVAYLRQAGDRALSAAAAREAAQYFEQALAALGHLPETRQVLEEVVDLRLRMRHALWPQLRLPGVLDHLQKADSIAEDLQDRRRQGWIACYLCQYFWAAGHLERALAEGERALAIARNIDNPALLAETNFHRGIVQLALGDFRRSASALSETLRYLEDAITLADPEFPARPFALNGPVFLRSWIVRSLAELGDFPEAIARGGEALRLADASRSPFALAAASGGLGVVYVRKGELATAIQILEPGMKVCHTYGLDLWIPTVGSLLGAAYARVGRIDEGVTLLQESVDHGDRLGLGASNSLWMILLGEAYLLAGRRSKAMSAARRALELCRERKERGYEAWALHLLAEMDARKDAPDCDAAKSRYEEALARARECGMRPLVAHCELGLGKLYARMGKPVEAEARLAMAFAAFRALDMPAPPPRGRAPSATDGPTEERP